ATAGRAADHPIQGTVLHLNDPGAPRARRIRFRAGGDAAIAPRAARDPRVVGATLAIVGTAAEDGSSGPVVLPGAHWKARHGGGVRYRTRAARAGVRRVVFKPGVLAVSGGGRGWLYKIDGPQGAIEARFAVGQDVYCARFDRFQKDGPARVLARGS